MKIQDSILVLLAAVGIFVVGKKILSHVQANKPLPKVETNMTNAPVEVTPAESEIIVMQPAMDDVSGRYDVVGWINNGR